MPLSQIDTKRAFDILPSCLEAMAVGLEIWDDQDRLVLYNPKDNHLRAGPFQPEDIGKTYGSLQGAAPCVIAAKRNGNGNGNGNGQGAGASQRLMARRTTHAEPVLQELPGDCWVKNFESLTAEGYLLVVRVNVTELVRQGRQLEAKNRQLARLCTTDGMTGLANRRHLDEVLTAEWQRASRSASHLSLLMIDIDHFKAYNDHYGHLAGDACLRKVADVLRQCTRRSGELAARYGGEEFVILLPGADAKRAQDIADKCLRLMHEQAIAHAVSPTAPVLTVSLGVASLQGRQAQTAYDLVSAADAALYRAKSGGRARLEMATPADWPAEQGAACPVSAH